MKGGPIQVPHSYSNKINKQKLTLLGGPPRRVARHFSVSPLGPQGGPMGPMGSGELWSTIISLSNKDIQTSSYKKYKDNNKDINLGPWAPTKGLCSGPRVHP